MRTIFPRGINPIPGSCPLGFHHVEHKVRTPRLIRVQLPAGKPRYSIYFALLVQKHKSWRRSGSIARRTGTLVAREAQALHADACASSVFVLVY